LGLSILCARGYAAERPNVILVICDDLNDYVEGYDGHPDAVTPNMTRLAESGVRFTQAHCNIPICGPSRASLFTGVYPHNSGCFGFTKWDSYEVLKNSRTLMDHFRANGYRTLGTGKLMHHMVRQEWKQYGNRADYGPFAFAAGEKVAHPDVPTPFRDIGPVDGSFGPFVNLKNRTTPDGTPIRWQNGGWGNQAKTLRVDSQEDRDLTPDELNGDWAAENIRSMADHPGRQPFFMGVGFIRPHTPLIVPQRFFDMFPWMRSSSRSFGPAMSKTHSRKRFAVFPTEKNRPRLAPKTWARVCSNSWSRRTRHATKPFAVSSRRILRAWPLWTNRSAEFWTPLNNRR
jgi:arylsulfatase A-like enzyme